VGHCASGKSSVVAGLRSCGFDAYSVAQEHSAVHDLWAHLEPDRLLFLDVSLDVIRKRRRNPNWPDWIYESQEKRLADARNHAHLVIDTDDLSVDEVVRQAVSAFG
jgi:hypothetical protein